MAGVTAGVTVGSGPTSWTVPVVRAALASTCVALADVCADLTADQWAAPTGCPGWDVHDQVAHVVGLEAVLLGGPVPAEPAAYGPHVSGGPGQYMERMVLARRGMAPDAMLAELRAVVGERQGQLAGLGDDPTVRVHGPMGVMSLLGVLKMRVFDCVAHEQDVRRAVGRPGNLDGPAAAVARDNTATGLAHAFGPLAPGKLIGLDIDGWTYLLDLTGDRAKVRPVDAEGPLADLSLAVGLGAALQLGCGRTDADPGAVVVTGDAGLGAALVAAMNFTP